MRKKEILGIKLPPYSLLHSTYRVSWLVGWQTKLGWLLLGAICSFLLTILSLGWFTSRPAGPVHPSVVETSRTDLGVQLEQEYLNREIANALKLSPIKLLDTLNLKRVQLALQSGELATVTIGLEALSRDFEFVVTDRLGVEKNQGAVQLELVGDVRFQVFNLPVAVLNGVVQQVNTLVANQINQQIGAVGQKNADCLICQKIGRRPVLQSLTTSSGWLTARFKIEIE